MQLRPAQAKILAYRGGRLAVNAVPGSGKTFTLSYLAAQLIADGKIDPDQQQVLIVTYLNSSVSNFRASVRQRLEEMELSAEIGFDVRTLHSLAREITRVADGGLGDSAEIPVLDDVLRETYLHNAVNSWIEANHDLWSQFLTDNNPQTRSRWRDSTFSMARAFIRTAKNERWTHDQIQATLRQNSAEGNDPNAILLAMNAGIYAIYQAQLIRQSVRDFDDLIWDAVDLLETRPSLAAELRERWPYVLEDEAQDSVPLQEVLLTALTGPDGNWVRVGDPNQAITSTFTAAHPRFFNAFIARPDVVNLPLPNSGRSAPMIFGAANALLDWVIDEHPEPEVRAHTFLRQHILPTPEGDAQPNPPDAEANVVLKVYKSREEEEIPTVARLALEYVRKFPQRTAAILTPTNRLGFSFADWLDDLEAPYDNLLHGNSRQREIASSMHAILALLADPLSNRELVSAHASLHELQHPAAQISAELVPRFMAKASTRPLPSSSEPISLTA